jgi:putative membrane protein
VDLLQTLPSFLAYFATALALFGLFASLYIRLTPYAELELIRAGNLAAALALIGALLGFALPLASSIAHSTSLLDMLVWGCIAMLVQALVYLAVARLLPELRQGITGNCLAHGLFLGGSALCAGLLNAACMVY